MRRGGRIPPGILSGTELIGFVIEPTMSDRHAQYEPVAWWYTRRRIGREFRNCYPVPEELPARLLALISELDGKPKVSFADDVPALHL
jgi:hypothetical protein